jgi:hypothetical protein
MSLPVSLGPGQSFTLSYQALEQVSALTLAGVEVGGTSATRTYTAEFRWGTNGTTWSAWLTYNTATVAALALNANNLFYREVRVTRTGADMTGFITWTLDVLNYTINPSATSGHGALVDLTMQTDIASLFTECIQYKMPTTAGGKPRFEVSHTWPRGQSRTGGLYPIYIYDIRQNQSANTRMGGQSAEFRWQMNIAVKTLGENKGDLVQGAPIFEFAMGVIRRMFDPLTWHVETYDITFKSVVFVAMTLNEMGIYDLTMEDRGTGVADNDYFQTFTVNFAIETSRTKKYGYTSL